MAGVERIELSRAVLETAIIPLNYTPILAHISKMTYFEKNVKLFLQVLKKNYVLKLMGDVRLCVIE